MSQQLWLLKSRLSSISNITEITNAMKLVASVKLKQYQKKIKNIKFYQKKLNEQLVYLINDYQYVSSSSLFLKSNFNAQKIAFVVFSSNVGLCGAYNENIIKYLKNSLKNNKEEVDIYIYGKYGQTLLNNFKKANIKNLCTHKLELNHEMLNDIVTDEVIYKYLQGEYKEVKVLYTHYINPLKQKVKEQAILPVKLENNIYNYYNTAPYILYDEDPEVVFDYIIKKITKDLVFIYYLQARISEEASRHNCMFGASENGEKLIKQLELDFNKQRQAKITQEMNEIISSNL